MTLGNGYHGHGGSAYLTNFSPYNHEIPKTQGMELAPFPDMYRCPFPKDEAPQRYAELMEQNISYATSGQMALFMIEGVQGAGGCIPMNKEFI
jgi:4-aminobutyrate aminotransferase-like enzyme